MTTPAIDSDARARDPQPGQYRIDPSGSTIGFTVRHMFGIGRARGTFALLRGEIIVEDSLSESRAAATAAAASFATGNPKRDERVKSAEFLDVEAHPELGFRSTSARLQGDTWVLYGYLTVRGFHNPIVLTIVSARSDELGLAIRATGRVDRFAFGITRMKGMAGRYLTLDITARASRAPG